METYTYSVSGDTINGKVIPDMLQMQISMTGLTTVNCINIYTDILDICFTSGLTTEEKDLLDITVYNHTGEYPYFTIYDVMMEDDFQYSTFVPPYEIDFTLLGLYRVPTVVEGELDSVTYYKDITMDEYGNKTYENPCVEKNIIYTRIDGYLYKRDTIIYWYLDTGAKCSLQTKTVIKYYNNDEAIEAGKKRRNYIINTMMITFIGLLMQTEVYSTGTTSINYSGTSYLEDDDITFDSDYIGRTIVIGSDTWSVIAATDHILTLNGTATITTGQTYIALFSVIDANLRGATFLDMINIGISKYIKGYTTPLIDTVNATTTYDTGITYNYPSVVQYEDVFYECTGSVITGEWDVSDWRIKSDCTWKNNVIPNTGGITIRQYLVSQIDIGEV